MSKRLALTLFVVAIAVAAVAAWRLLSAPEVRPPAVRASTYPLALTDDDGFNVTITAEPGRIVTFGPHLTEALILFEAVPRLVGVSAADDAPEVAALPRPAEPDQLTPNVEAVLELQPNLVVTSLPAGAWKERLKAEGTTVVTLRASSVPDAIRDLRVLGRIVGTPLPADTYAGVLELGLERIARNLKGQAPKRVFLETGYEPLATTGDPYVTDLLRRAHATLVPKKEKPSAELSFDELKAADPEVYVVPASHVQDAGGVSARPRFQELQAVAGERVVVIADDLLFLPGPRLLRAIQDLANGIHPDARIDVVARRAGVLCAENHACRFDAAHGLPPGKQGRGSPRSP